VTVQGKRREVTGVGIGLRVELAAALLEREPPEVRFLEIHPENYIRRGGRFAENLERSLERWPILTHGLTLGFGNVEPYDRAALGELRALLERVGTPWHSDHLCFAAAAGTFAHDLLPVPQDEATVRHCAARIREMRDAIGREVALENVSFYAIPNGTTMDEATFVLEVLERADAKLLLDVNNVYVNAKNHGFDARGYIDRIPPERVVQIHVAGHWVRRDGIIIDTHGEAICEDVYALLEHTLERMGPVPVLLERDGNFPTFDALLDEVRRLDEIWRRATGAAAA